jgi:hypothetical protein
MKKIFFCFLLLGIITSCSFIKSKPVEIPVGCEDSFYYKNKLLCDTSLIMMVTGVNSFVINDPIKYQLAREAANLAIVILQGSGPITFNSFREIPGIYLIFTTPLISLVNQNVEFNKCDSQVLIAYLKMITG